MTGSTPGSSAPPAPRPRRPPGPAGPQAPPAPRPRRPPGRGINHLVEPSGARPVGFNGLMDERTRVSDDIGGWLSAEGEKTLGSLIETFGAKSFAVLFVFLLGVPALPLPTGGATHVFEIIAMLLSLQLLIGRDEVWLPARWQRLELAGRRQQRFISGLLRLIRWLERFTRPRGVRLFEQRISSSVFGLVVILLSLGAFVAPPFSGLDTLPALGVVLISLSVLIEDVALTAVGIAVGASGVVLEYVLGRAALSGLSHLL